MTLPPGRRLGPYEIESLLGAGGMGQVYKARDVRLGRTVAIKTLPPHLSADPELRRRFGREAEAIAALNHPHICTLYDVSRHEEIDFLVMEYVEGESLADRLGRAATGASPARTTTRGLPLADVLRFSSEMADALDRAHRRGIVHRDFKPGNVMLTRSGVKLLDFGLARFLPAPGPLDARGAGAAADAFGETRAVDPARQGLAPLTVEGTILGTLQYMAPEQLEGRDAEARTDVFAFGAVVYEMVTGRRPFEGASQASLIASILERDPPPLSDGEVGAAVPAALEHLLARCLAKDPEARWQSMRDVKAELDWIARQVERGPVMSGAQGLPASAALGATGVARDARGWRRMLAGRLGWAIAGALIGAAIGAGAVQSRTAPPRREPVYATLLPGEGEAVLPVGLALSPDGRRVVYVARRGGGRQQLYVRDLGHQESVALAGTEGAFHPFFSPDGRWLGFFTPGELKKMPIDGGRPFTVSTDVAPVSRGATWTADDRIVVARSYSEGLSAVRSSGGAMSSFTTLDAAREEFGHQWPELLPGERAVLFTVRTSGTSDDSRIAVQTLPTGERKVLVERGTHARYVPGGHLVYEWEGALFAVPFDADRLKVLGPPVQVVGGVMSNPWAGLANFAVSGEGHLVYLAGGLGLAEKTLVWVDRAGGATPVSADRRMFTSARLAPDGQTLAVAVQGASSDVWLLDVARGVFSRFTYGGSEDWTPVWTPDGRRVVYAAGKAMAYPQPFWKSLEGGQTEERLTREAPGLARQAPSAAFPTSWSPDGRLLAVTVAVPGTADISLLSVDGDRALRPLVHTPYLEYGAAFSPDGQWVAYVSQESGRGEVYLMPYGRPGPRRQVSPAGGRSPVWARSGRELFYYVGRRMMVVDIGPDGTRVSAPRVLFEGDYECIGLIDIPFCFDVTADGQRFVMIRPRRSPGAYRAARRRGQLGHRAGPPRADSIGMDTGPAPDCGLRAPGAGLQAPRSRLRTSVGAWLTTFPSSLQPGA